MLITATLLLTLGAIAADLFVWLRRLRREPSAPLRRLFAVWCLVSDLLPFSIAIVNWLSHDNTTPVMAFSMWAFWLYLVLVLPRLLYYVFRLCRLPRAGAAAGVALAAVFVWGATCGRTTLVVNRVTVQSERLPESFEGFRVAQFSDVHVGAMVNPERELRRLVDTLNALRPDLVVFCGDLVNIRASELDGRVREILAGLEAPCGVYSVTGNHDVGVYIRDTLSMPPAENLSRLVTAQRSMGWYVLEDTTAYIVRGCDSIALTGISFDAELQEFRHSFHLPELALSDAYRGVPDSLFDITLSHLPQLWPNITALGRGDLTLSGHVHSMQFQLHLFGRRLSPAQWLYDRWSGRYDSPGSTLYINDGIGYVGYPMRLGAYPEITLFTLTR